MIDGEPVWVLTVTGKGKRIREVPIVETVMRCLDDDLAARGLPADPREAAPQAPLVAAIAGTGRGARSAGARALRQDVVTLPAAAARGADARLPAAQLYRELKRVFAAASEGLQTQGARGAARVAQGSAHWLRHTFATHAIETVAPDVVGSVLGHASLAATAPYARTDLRRKARALRGFDARGQVSPPGSRSRG
jgi:site-specific recombinase XerC